MSDADLAKRMKDVFTGLPKFPSDPVNWFGLEQESTFIERKKIIHFSIHTVLYEVKSQCCLFSPQTQENWCFLSCTLYYKGNKMFFKADFKAQLKILPIYILANRCYLGNLSLPLTPILLLVYEEYTKLENITESGKLEKMLCNRCFVQPISRNWIYAQRRQIMPRAMEKRRPMAVTKFSICFTKHLKEQKQMP